MTQLSTADGFVEASAVASGLRVSTRQVQKLAKAGILPSIRISDRCIRFDPDAVGTAVGSDADNARRIAEVIRAADEVATSTERES